MAPKWPIDPMPLYLRIIDRSIFENSPVVAGENDEGIFLQTISLKRFQHFTNRPVELIQEVPVFTDLACSLKARSRNKRTVNISVSKVEEKRFLVLVLVEPRDGSLGEQGAEFIMFIPC